MVVKKESSSPYPWCRPWWGWRWLPWPRCYEPSGCGQSRWRKTPVSWERPGKTPFQLQDIISVKLLQFRTAYKPNHFNNINGHNLIISLEDSSLLVCLWFVILCFINIIWLDVTWLELTLIIYSWFNLPMLMSVIFKKQLQESAKNYNVFHCSFLVKKTWV